MAKICIKCRNTKVLDQFHRNPKSKDGRVNICKVCKSIYDTARGKDISDNNELLHSWGRASVGRPEPIHTE